MTTRFPRAIRTAMSCLCASAMRLVTLAALIAMLTGAVNVTAQNSGQPKIDLKGDAILNHLNAVVIWYRQVTANLPAAAQPSDQIYQDNARSLAVQAAQLAFQSARAEAALIAALEKEAGTANQTAAAPDEQGFAQMEAKVSGQIKQLQSQIEALDGQIAQAPASKREALVSQRDNLQGELDLSRATLDAIHKMIGFVEGAGESVSGGLQERINQLARSIPEVKGNVAPPTPPAKPAGPQGTNSKSSGLFSQAFSVYEQISSMRQLDQLGDDTASLREITTQLRKPLVDALRATVQRGRDLANQPPTSDLAKVQADKEAFKSLVARFKQLSDAAVPLSQEIIVLDQTHANFDEWYNAVSREYKQSLRSLLARILVLALLLGFVLILSEVWRRLTFRYIHEPRRRRQFLLLRRFVIGILISLIFVVGLVSEFSSLATFAGFITAGVAVALQAVLLSVAAYFFLIGRYGIRVGDRISVAGVTGEVVDVGIVRMYLSELAGSGVDLYPTGRIVVLSNSVLFQATTPLFKQIPGAEYTWHEVVMDLIPGSNYKLAHDKLLEVVHSVYSKYRPEFERLQSGMERQFSIQLAAPTPEAKLQFTEKGLESAVRYPVDFRRASEIDDEVTRKLAEMIAQDPALQAAVSGSPKIRNVLKG